MFCKKKSFALWLLVFFLLSLIILIPFTGGSVGSGDVEFEVLPVRNYSISLAFGVQPERTRNWSLISLPIAPINESVDSFVSTIDGNWEMLFTYRNGDSDIALPGGGGDLDNVYLTYSYWVKMTNSDNLSFDGINYEDSLESRSVEIPLVVGWNIIGYPYNYPKNVSDVLSGIDGKWDILAKFHNPPYGENNKTWIEISPDMAELFWELDNFTQFVPSFGYEIHINQSCNLAYTF